MKLRSLFVQNFLGIAAAEVELNTAVTVFCGRNRAGKSSLRDAVALALTADLGRVHQKKEAPALVRDGADAAVCEVVDTNGDAYRVTISAKGKITDSRSSQEADPVLALVLDGQRFAQWDEKARRSFLFDLMGLKSDGPAVKKRLLDKGCDPAKVEKIAAFVRSGFEAGCKEAKGRATEAKGAWRQLTGEAYGPEKAKTWQAGVPPVDASNLPTLQTEIRHADAALETWQRQIGQLEAEKKRRAEIGAKLQALDEHASRVERIRTKLATDEQVLRNLDADIEKTAAAAGVGPRVGLVHKLADHIDLMLDHGERMGWFSDSGDRNVQQHARALVVAYEDEHGKLNATAGDPAAAARLQTLRQAHVNCTSAVANSRRDLDAAIGAGTLATDIRAELAKPFDSAGLASAMSEAAKIREQRAAAQQRLDTQEALKKEADAAAKRTVEALQLHTDVQQWDAIGDALAPDGIPGEILASALGPINDRLLQSAGDTGWPQVAIDADMRITAGGRTYGLLSESEQWRADAMLAEAVSHISGTQLLVLDRIDVLDQVARGELMEWMDICVDNGEIATALLFGTLKAVPNGLPETITAHWVENGVVGVLAEAA